MPDTIWLDGRYLPASRAQVPVTTHAIHYGTCAFEGIRAYWDGSNLHVFRLGDHMARLMRSCSMYGMRPRFTAARMGEAVVGTIRRKKLRGPTYARPFCFVGDHGISLHVDGRARVRSAVMAFPMGRIFPEGGISARIVSRRKIPEEAVPVQAKMAGNYLNSIAATAEARAAGADEAILLDSRGMVSEAPGENIFVVRRGTASTPPIAASALDGITRDTVLELAAGAGIPCAVEDLPRSSLAMADEVFLTGTAAEITPVTRIDGRRVGSGRPGPVTRRMASLYDDAVHGRGAAREGWLTAVYP
ncbi:MAG: branched-chain amino acid transaminase [Nitrosopumilus sp.]|nr:branched-chain amino acid transaminase [Nitrosopumilus sp.]MDA7944073.1 branched-chain amino acid transaminase [Nitrosopumilus sp.]MDA7953766.1 branched-chain amino acid transaminase [Nitrosopumilus sp.]MDA7958765.1 branched-chain amino acid transaminase [Nitrosopumilus sp.]MDA7999402.1 branched-chain amino acid transaminase [Nitrosopumilus sp.]